MATQMVKDIILGIVSQNPNISYEALRRKVGEALGASAMDHPSFIDNLRALIAEHLIVKRGANYDLPKDITDRIAREQQGRDEPPLRTQDERKNFGTFTGECIDCRQRSEKLIGWRCPDCRRALTARVTEARKAQPRYGASLEPPTRMTILDEVIDFLKSSLTDERDADAHYSVIISTLRHKLNRYDLAAMVEKIREDERAHKAIIERVLAELEGAE